MDTPTDICTDSDEIMSKQHKVILVDRVNEWFASIIQAAARKLHLSKAEEKYIVRYCLRLLYSYVLKKLELKVETNGRRDNWETEQKSESTKDELDRSSGAYTMHEQKLYGMIRSDTFTGRRQDSGLMEQVKSFNKGHLKKVTSSGAKMQGQGLKSELETALHRLRQKISTDEDSIHFSE